MRTIRRIKSFTKILLLLLLIGSYFNALAVDPGEITNIVKGKITTSDGLPAAFVNVEVKGIKKNAVTDEEGNFVIHGIEPGNYELEISLVGYETIVERINLSGNKNVSVDIKLKLTQKQLQEVIVTGGRKRFTRQSSEFVSKMPLKNMENPQVYTTITKDLMAEQLVFSVDDATRNATGLQKMWEATGRSGDGGAYYNARGFIVQSLLRNGIAGNITSRVDAANIESIEIIKGPSATLFGSTLSSYGGLINRITKKPYEKFGGEVSYSTGSYSFNRVAADINTPLDSAKNILFRLNTAYNYEGSFADNGFDRQFVLAPSFSFKVNDKLSFSFDAEFYNGANTSKQIIFFYYPAAALGASRADQLGIDYKRSYSSGDIYQTYKNTSLFAQMKYIINEHWTSQTNFTSAHSYSDGPYAYFYVTPNSVVTGNSEDVGADYLTRADQSTAGNQVQYTEIQQNFIGNFYIGRFKNRFVGGLDYYSENSDQLFFGVEPFDIIPKNGTIPTYGNFNIHKLDSALAGDNVWNYPYSYKTKSYSAYVSDVFNITDNLIVLAALRIDHFDNVGSFDEATGQYTGNYKQTTLSPKFGLVYQPIKDKISIFANYQNGFTNQTGTDYAGKIFKPEEANQMEGGIKLDLLGGNLTGTLSYYQIRVKDMVRPYAANPNFSIQDGTQLSKGFEAEVIAKPFSGMNVVAGFSYNDSKFTKADADVEGRRPATAMSPVTANCWLSYTLQYGNLKGLGIGFGGNYASDNKILNSESMGTFILPAYTILNATAFYDQPKFRLGIKVDNLTNQEYWIGYTTMNPQKLISLTGSIAFKF